jgi:lipopolysaccharide export LptBFGC system permease protein LptF
MKFNMKSVTLLFSIIIFLAGFVLYTSDAIVPKIREEKEGLEDKTNQSNCPNLLVRRGNSLLLYDTTRAEDSNNPISFFDLDEYANYVKIQHRKGNHCPVLYLQRENDTQGNDVYKMHSTPFFIEGGLPALPLQTHDNTIPIKTIDAGRENPQWNQNQFNSFDPYGLNIGRFTDIDVLHNSTQQQTGGSENPMDSGWLGVIATQNAVDSGVYSGNEVGRPIYPKISPK